MERQYGILVVDDEPGYRKTLSDILRLKGYRVVEAADGNAVLAQLDECKDAGGVAPPEVALIDLMLQDVSGLDLIQEIKARSPFTECILLTGYASQNSAIQAVNLGAYGYVQKPCDMESLLIMIRRAIEKQDAQRALRESEERYRRLVESSNDMVFSVDRDGVFRTADGVRLREFGMTTEDMVGRSLESLFGERGRGYAERHRQILSDGKTFTFENVFELGGRERTDLINVYPIKDEHGEVESVGVVCRDITERKQAEEEIRQRNRELAALLHVSELLAGRVDLEALLDVIVGAIVDTLPVAEGASLWLYDEQRDCLVARAWAGSSEGISAPGGEALPLARQVYRTGQPYIPGDAGGEVLSGTGVPLTVEGQVVGAILVESFSHIQAFSERDLDLLQSLASQVAVAIRDAQLFEEVTRQHKQLRELHARLEAAEEAERQRLARLLHDLVGQNLTVLGLNLNIAHSQLPGDTPDLVNTYLDDSIVLVKQVTKCVRDVMVDLRPPVLDDCGLVAALRWYGERVVARAGVAVDVRGEEPALSPSVSNTVFRIAQEALTNVVKHAQAQTVQMSVDSEPGGLRLVIEDDGVGFDAASLSGPDENHGWGLLTMIERAITVGGRCEIQSRPQAGTRVVLEVPR
jgi:PAS domain S-box-containing protein